MMIIMKIFKTKRARKKIQKNLTQTKNQNKNNNDKIKFIPILNMVI